jgi:hypothetical protein
LVLVGCCGVDLLILCRQPERLVGGENWTKQFGEVVTSRKKQYGVVISIRVFYASGIEAEFTVAMAS